MSILVINAIEIFYDLFGTVLRHDSLPVSAGRFEIRMVVRNFTGPSVAEAEMDFSGLLAGVTSITGDVIGDTSAVLSEKFFLLVEADAVERVSVFMTPQSIGVFVIDRNMAIDDDLVISLTVIVGNTNDIHFFHGFPP